jgi:hypothetical protein
MQPRVTAIDTCQPGLRVKNRCGAGGEVHLPARYARRRRGGAGGEVQGQGVGGPGMTRTAARGDDDWATTRALPEPPTHHPIAPGSLNKPLSLPGQFQLFPPSPFSRHGDAPWRGWGSGALTSSKIPRRSLTNTTMVATNPASSPTPTGAIKLLSAGWAEAPCTKMCPPMASWRCKARHGASAR